MLQPSNITNNKQHKTLFIFDMDGVLIDSEPFWRKAQINILATFNITITVADCIQYTMGKRLDDIAKTWIQLFKLPCNSKLLAETILNQVIHLIEQHGQAKTGIIDLLKQLQTQQARIALASSSSQPLIQAVTQKLNITHYFEVMISADSVPLGKPAPDVYLSVCQTLNVSPEQSIALEDSATGMQSALNANITTIAIPEVISAKFDKADHIVVSIADVQNILQQNYFFA